jgi:hypothetical protein
MLKRNNDINLKQGPGCPLLFHPPKQLTSRRAERQEAIYWAQIDLRYDLELIWRMQEADGHSDGQIFLKLILPDGTQKEFADYFADLKPSMTYSYLFPIENV